MTWTENQYVLGKGILLIGARVWERYGDEPGRVWGKRKKEKKNTLNEKTETSKWLTVVFASVWDKDRDDTRKRDCVPYMAFQSLEESKFPISQHFSVVKHL